MGQKVLYVGGVGLQKVGIGGWNLQHPDFFLEVKPFYQITDEYAIELAKLSGLSDDEMQELMDDKTDWITSINLNELPLISADFLRSKGYALPAYGYSVEQLVEEGVFKLKSKTQ